MSANLDKLLQQQQGLNAFRDSQKNAFNGYDLEKGIYDAKRQALQTGKNISQQLVGQERLEALMAAPAIGKTVMGLGKTALKAAANPSEFAEGAKAQAYEGLKSQFKSITGRDLPGSLDEARAGAEAEARGAVSSVADRAEGALSSAREAGDRAVQTAQSAGRTAQETAEGTAQRFRQTVDNQIPETGEIEESALQQGRSPFFQAPARRVAEPGDIDYAAQQGARRALETPDMPVGEVPSVGGFPREGLPTPRGSIGDPAPVTESVNRANILRDAQRTAEPIEDAPRLSARPFDNQDLPDLEPLKTTEQRIQDVRSGLRPTETRAVEPDLAEAQRLGARPIARSLARQPLTAEEAQRAGYRPPTTPRPARPGRIREEPGPTEGAETGEYTRPGTNLRIPATREQVPQFRGEAPSAVAEREESEAADQALAERGSVADLFGQAERGGARAARTVAETATDDTIGSSRSIGADTEGDLLRERLGRLGSNRINPAEQQATAEAEAQPEDYGLPDIRPMPKFPEPPGTTPGGLASARPPTENVYPSLEGAERTGGDVPSTARGEETSTSGAARGAEPEGTPQLQPERGSVSQPSEPYQNEALNERFGSARPEQPDLPTPEASTDRFGLPKAPAAADEASVEADSAKVADDAAETALKTTGEEVAAEAPLDAVPGLGEIVMAGTLLGSLFHAHHEEKEQEKQTAGPPPAPPTTSMPTMAFDSAPTLDTSSYHSL